MVAETGGQVLFIRPQPNQSQAPIGSFNDGATVRVDCFITNGQFVTGPTASSGVWHRLNGRSGWVSGVYLRGGAWGGVAGEPRCASGGGPYAPPARYTKANACGLADITFFTATKEMSVKFRAGKVPSVAASGYRCLADSLVVNWVNPGAARKWLGYLRNEIRNHATAYLVFYAVPSIRSHANPADIDLREYPHNSYKSPQWKIDWTTAGISYSVMKAWILR